MKKILKPLLVVLIGAGIITIYWFTPFREFIKPAYLLTFIQHIRETWWSPIALISIAIGSTLLALPVSPFTLLIAASFGFKKGLLYNLIALNIGAVVSFYFARYLGRSVIERFLHHRLKKIDDKAAKHGFRLIFYLRLVPVFPFIMINYMAGLSKVSLKDYWSASAIALLPSLTVYTYFAASLLSGVEGAQGKAFTHMILSAILMIVISTAPILYKKFRKKHHLKEIPDV